jgi:hypothetical protein
MLLNLGRLDGAAKGVAAKVLKSGPEALSEKQRFVYEKYVLGDYANTTCKLCKHPIPLNEAICAKEDNDGYCSHCANMLAKL